MPAEGWEEPPPAYGEGEPELTNEKVESPRASEEVETELVTEKEEPPPAYREKEPELSNEEGESLPPYEEKGSPPSYAESESRLTTAAGGHEIGAKAVPQTEEDLVGKNGLKAETVLHVEELPGNEKIGSPPQDELSESEQALLAQTRIIENPNSHEESSRNPDLGTGSSRNRFKQFKNPFHNFSSANTGPFAPPEKEATASLPTHTVQFSPDGRTITETTSAGPDGETTETTTVTKPAQPTPAAPTVAAAAFSPHPDYRGAFAPTGDLATSTSALATPVTVNRILTEDGNAAGDDDQSTLTKLTASASPPPPPPPPPFNGGNWGHYAPSVGCHHSIFTVYSRRCKCTQRF